MKNIIGPIVSMLIECKISDVHLKIFIICRNGVIKLMMKKVGLNVNIKWTVYTRIHLLKYYLIHCSTRCMNVPTEQVKINLDVKRKKEICAYWHSAEERNVSKSFAEGVPTRLPANEGMDWYEE